MPVSVLGAVINIWLPVSISRVVLHRQSADQPRLSLADVRQMIQMETERLNSARPQPQPTVEYVNKDPELRPESNGKGSDMILT